MEKTPRYTQRERHMVLGYAARYKDVIENKRTDAESNRKKDEVWRQIAKEFNSRVYHQRSSKQLRQLYKNMKLLLKKDLCGEEKVHRSFNDLLNTLSQQDSVAQYISQKMSPNDYSLGGTAKQPKFDDDYDDSKLPSGPYDAMDTDVIVIKSEDISDNEQSHNGGDLIDDDDDDSLSPKDIPEVCLEEEDDAIYSPGERNNLMQMQSSPQHQQQQRHPQLNAQQHQEQTTNGTNGQQQPEVSIQNVGGIRVSNIASMKASHNTSLSLTNTTGINNNNNNNSNNNHNINNNQRQLTVEQAQQQVLFNNLGLSAVHPPPLDTPMPTLQRANPFPNVMNVLSNTVSLNNNGVGNNSTKNNSGCNSLLMNISNGAQYGQSPLHNLSGSSLGSMNGSGNSRHSHQDYLVTLQIKERKKRIDLLDAQIDYWKTMAKKVESSPGHIPSPACPCHFPSVMNGLQAPSSSS